MENQNEKKYCTLYLVRHGETEWNVSGFIMGQSDSPLTQRGIEQVQMTAQALKNVDFDAIFSSDLPRAEKTAEILRLDKKIPIETSKLLRERNYGKFEKAHISRYIEELKDKLKERENLPDEEYNSYRLDSSVETTEEILIRFMGKLRKIASVYPDKNVLVATHGGCLKSFLIKMGYTGRKKLPGGSFKHGGYVKVLSDGKNFFIKEVHGIEILNFKN